MKLLVSGFVFLAVLSVQAPALGAGFCRDLLTPRQGLSKEEFSPERLARRQFERSEFPFIRPERLKDLRVGSPNERFFTAHFEGASVIGKRILRDSYREAAWLQELNKLGLGVRFYGLAEIQGQIYFVMERVPGINTNVPDFATPIAREAVVEMRRQFDLMIENGIYPLDMQFQVSRDSGKVALVDPELFEVRALSTEKTQRHWRFFELALRTNFVIDP